MFHHHSLSTHTGHILGRQESTIFSPCLQTSFGNIVSIPLFASVSLYASGHRGLARLSVPPAGQGKFSGRPKVDRARISTPRFWLCDAFSARQPDAAGFRTHGCVRYLDEANMGRQPGSEYFCNYSFSVRAHVHMHSLSTICWCRMFQTDRVKLPCSTLYVSHLFFISVICAVIASELLCPVCLAVMREPCTLRYALPFSSTMKHSRNTENSFNALRS